MKKLLSTAIATALTATGLLATSATLNTAAAEVSFNAGVMSQYIFRGMTQRDSASINAGVDYEHKSGLYAGLWAAQVGTEAGTGSGPFLANNSTSNGWEYDIYGGYKTSFGDLGLGAGFTSYQYTNKYNGTNTGFDTAYNELNFELSYGPITATINPGYHEVVGNSNKSYVFYSLKGEYKGFYALYGAFDKSEEKAKYGYTSGFSFDAVKNGNYIQAGYTTTLGGIDLEAAIVKSSKELNTVGSKAGIDDNTTMFISASKSF
jgi:uncharacterized protein (TIGR02001 family)